MRASYATPNGASGAATSRSLAPAHTALHLVAVVDVAHTLASVPLSIFTSVDVVNTKERGVLHLAVKTTSVTSKGGLHVKTGSLTVALHGAGLLGELVNLLALLRVNFRDSHSYHSEGIS